MEARELRLGNWVYHSSGNIIDVEIINSEIEEDDLQPIPLTEEWLLNFGFEECNEKVTKKEKGFDINRKKPYKSIYIRTSIGSQTGFFSVFNYSSCDDEIQFIRKVNFVHDLQNLYWCLYEEELILQGK